MFYFSILDSIESRVYVKIILITKWNLKEFSVEAEVSYAKFFYMSSLSSFLPNQ